MLDVVSQMGKVPAEKIFLTAQEFVDRHDLTLASFYMGLSTDLKQFPKLAQIAGELRFCDYDGADGQKFAVKTKPPMAPDTGGVQYFVSIDLFCQSFGITVEMLPRMALEGGLPQAFQALHDPKTYFIDAKHVAHWELARRAEVGKVTGWPQ